jgi:hypothetical protein
MAMVNEDFPRPKKQKPFSMEADRADVFAFENNEIGLLDIVILDVIASSEACNH